MCIRDRGDFGHGAALDALAAFAPDVAVVACFTRRIPPAALAVDVYKRQGLGRGRATGAGRQPTGQTERPQQAEKTDGTRAKGHGSSRSIVFRTRLARRAQAKGLGPSRRQMGWITRLVEAGLAFGVAPLIGLGGEGQITAEFLALLGQPIHNRLDLFQICLLYTSRCV